MRDRGEMLISIPQIVQMITFHHTNMLSHGSDQVTENASIENILFKLIFPAKLDNILSESSPNSPSRSSLHSFLPRRQVKLGRKNSFYTLSGGLES